MLRRGIGGMYLAALALLTITIANLSALSVMAADPVPSHPPHGVDRGVDHGVDHHWHWTDRVAEPRVVETRFVSSL